MITLESAHYSSTLRLDRTNLFPTARRTGPATWPGRRRLSGRRGLQRRLLLPPTALHQHDDGQQRQRRDREPVAARALGGEQHRRDFVAGGEAVLRRLRAALDRLHHDGAGQGGDAEPRLLQALETVLAVLERQADELHDVLAGARLALHAEAQRAVVRGARGHLDEIGRRPVDERRL